MGIRKIDSAVASDLTTAIKDYSVDTITTDGPSGQGITKGRVKDWPQNLGYYKTIPEIRIVIDAKSTWCVGKGFTADEETTMLLDTIKGWGKDTFNSILENMIRTYHIAGDAVAEIIRDDEENLINIKVLSPDTVEWDVNPQGIIERYWQTSRTNKPAKEIKKENIWHLTKNRTADEVHGISMIQSLVNIILMKNEAMADNKIINHRYAYPRWIFHLDTDDETEILAFKAKHDKANAKGENMYIPKDVVVPELVAVAPNATINLLPWIQYLDNLFYEVAGVPKIIVGGSGEFTEASGKIAYLAFQQNVEEEQLYNEESILSQLNLVINLEFPVSLENELLTDKAKDGAQSIQPNETTAGSGQ